MLRLPLWVISFAAAWILFLVMGLRQGFGLFLPPLADELAIDRATFGFGIAVSNLLWGIGAPLAGAIADRFGPGRVTAGGGLLYAGGLIVLAMAAGANDYLIGHLLVGIGLSAAGFSVVLAAAGKAAPIALRARVMAIASMGGSLGQFLMIPITQWVIQEWEWRAAYLVLAVFAATIIPFARAVAGIKVAHAETRDQTLRAALAEAFRVPSFWLLTIGFFVCGFQLNFISTHMPAYLVDNGLSQSMGAAVLATIGLTNIFGTYLFGRMGERLPKKSILGWLYFARGVLVVGLLVLPLTPATALVFAVGMGVTWLATIPLTGGLVGTFFGPQYMATLYGVVFFGHQLGASCGALIGGLVFDATGSYTGVWWASAALCFIGAAMHWAIVERPVMRSPQVLAS
ncbi:MAG: MFS transporter [Betaproteobacteria bacterium]|nr:MFS transporter [Betaproteobacteria bacterium]